jgi:hypothetical protein
LPPEKRISAYFWYLEKYWKVARLHKQFYANSSVRIIGNSITAVGIVSFIVMLWILFRLP